MKKPDKRKAVQMYLSPKEEWTKRVPVLDGVAVSYAGQGQVGECFTGGEEETTLTTKLLEQVIALPNLERACHRVITNGGSAGCFYWQDSSPQKISTNDHHFPIVIFQ